MPRKVKSFRVGQVRGDLRGRVWYLTYVENGKRLRPRAGRELEEARRLAADINSQIEGGMPSVLNCDSKTITELQTLWLGHHEDVLRSSIQTVRRYRSATSHLLEFIHQHRIPQTTRSFCDEHAEKFVRYLRAIKVAPNGHPNSEKRKLLDKGIKFILMCCRSMFNFAIKKRYLPPYTDNPFSTLDLDRMPVENSRPVIIFTPQQERQFLESCDDWQFPLFLTLMLTGLRPGELTHLLLPKDVDLDSETLFIRNKPQLGWQVKTRNERSLPISSVLNDVLQLVVGRRHSGVLFCRRRFGRSYSKMPGDLSEDWMTKEIDKRVKGVEEDLDDEERLSRFEYQKVCQSVWRDIGAIKTDSVRKEFIRVCKKCNLSGFTSPKMLRHLFATSLQDANVDPLIRCELMGHSTRTSSGTHGMGMTAHYTHTRMETKHSQLEMAVVRRPAYQLAKEWVQKQ